MMHALSLVPLTLFLFTLVSAQIYTPGAPATVYFTPYKLSNCSMSNDISSTAAPSSYAVTSGHCYNSAYKFLSYAQATNFNAGNIPCSLSVYPQAGCKGQGVGVKLSNCASCALGPISPQGASFSLACGP